MLENSYAFSGFALTELLYRLIQQGGFENLPAIERVLRGINSRLFLQAVHPSDLGMPMARDPLSGEEREYSLFLVQAGSNPANDPQHHLNELQVSYEVNQTWLADAGLPTSE